EPAGSFSRVQPSGRVLASETFAAAHRARKSAALLECLDPWSPPLVGTLAAVHKAKHNSICWRGFGDVSNVRRRGVPSRAVLEVAVAMSVLAARRPEDVFTAGFFDDPYPTYRAMRERDPILELPFDLNCEQAQVINATGARTWMLTGYTSVIDALRDTDVFSSALPSPTGEAQTELEQGRLVLI